MDDLWETKWHWVGFLHVLQFPLPGISPNPLHSSSSKILWGWYNMPFSGLSKSGLSCTPPQDTEKKKDINDRKKCSLL
jgi:hypothetical protein